MKKHTVKYIIVVGLATGTLLMGSFAFAAPSWATYTNKQKGFSAAYPSEWSAPKEVTIGTMTLVQLGGKVLVVFGVTNPLEQKLSFDELSKKYDSYKGKSGASPMSRTDLMVGGHPSFTLLSRSNGEIKYLSTYIKNKNSKDIVQVYYASPKGALTLVDLATYKKIVESVRFK